MTQLLHMNLFVFLCVHFRVGLQSKLHGAILRDAHNVTETDDKRQSNELDAKKPYSADDGQRRVFQIADIHGDFGQLSRLLYKLGLTDAGVTEWKGGNAVLIFTGDYIDRGFESARVLRALIELEQKAKAAEGKVILLKGNHENMLETKDYHDMRRRDAEGYLSARPASNTSNNSDECEGNLPALPASNASNNSDGCLKLDERRRPADAILIDKVTTSLTSGYSSVLLKYIRNMPLFTVLRPPIVKEAVLFLHGGITWYMVEDCASAQIGFRAWLPISWESVSFTADDSVKIETCFHRKCSRMGALPGPLWSRRLSPDPRDPYGRPVRPEDEYLLRQTLRALGVTRIIVGHTVVEDTEWLGYNNRVIRTDFGMTRGWQCENGALVFDQATPVSALYIHPNQGNKNSVYLLREKQDADVPRFDEYAYPGFEAIKVPDVS